MDEDPELGNAPWSVSPSAKKAKTVSQKTPRALVISIALAYMASLVANKLTFRLVLVPMAPYSHLLAVGTNFAYMALFSALCRRQERQGFVLPAQRKLVSSGKMRALLAGAGLAEAICFVMMPVFASRLPGSMLPVLSQTMVPFSMLISTVALGKRYDRSQQAGVAVVVIGVAVCSYPKFSAGSGSALLGSFSASMGLVMSYFFFAASMVFKEAAFRLYEAESPSGERLSGILVSYVTTAWQGIALWALWPLNFAVVTHLSPGDYLLGALACLRRPATPLFILMYWIANVSHVVVSVFSLSMISSVLVLLTGAISIPVTAALFCLPLPMLPTESFSWYTMSGLIVIVAGLLVFNFKTLASK